MKKLLLLICLCASVRTIAQTTRVELFDLVRSLLPDSIQSGKPPAWNTNTEVNKHIRWKSTSPKKRGNYWYKEGIPSFVVGGKPFTCINGIEEKNVSCKWNLMLTGKTANGYSSVSLSASDFPIQEAGKEIELLFKKNKASFTSVKKCIEGVIMWNELYSVNMPGKKNSWMWAEYESLSATGAQYNNNGVTNTFSLTFYFNKKEADAYCK